MAARFELRHVGDRLKTEFVGPDMSRAQWLWLILLSILWGGAFFFIGVAVRELPPLTLVLARVGLGAAFLWIVLSMGRTAMPWTLSAWSAFAGMSLLNNVIPFTAIVAGQQTISSGLASVLNGTTPLWSVLLLHFFTRDDPLTPNRLVGVLIGALGVAVLVGPAALEGATMNLQGMLLILLATFSYGCSAVWGRRLRAVPPLVSSVGQLTCSTILLAPLALAIDQPWTMDLPSLEVVAAVIGLAIPSTAIAYLVFFHIASVSGTANVMLVTLLIPVSAVALGTLVLDEILLPRHILGGLIIGSALIVIDGRALGWLQLGRRASR
ncbi:MAG: DMT family transporter [Pseudomonadota bacterium]